MKLEASAMQYLRYVRRCVLVMLERSPWPTHRYRPDVIGIEGDRNVVEIECKRSMSDFRSNKDKLGFQWRTMGIYVPRQAYFLVNPEMVDHVIAEAPKEWGVMTLSDTINAYTLIPEIRIARKAAIDKRAVKVSMRDFMHCVRHQSGTMCKVMAKLSKSGG